ncbi:MAG: sigma-70 family RNA polymerase sigma factor [Bacteroidota bacterium]
MRKSKEQELFSALQAGQKDAILTLYRGHKRDFIKWCKRSFNLEEEDAADLYQDTVIIFYNNLRNGKLTDLTSSLKTYLFAIGKHLALKMIERKSKMVVSEDMYDPSLSYIPVDLFEEADKKKVIAKILNQMGEPCKSILTLFYFHGFSMDVIARRLNYKNEHVVKSQKLRCFKTLKEKATKFFDMEDLL